MSSGATTWWQRLLFRIPGLHKKCPEGNYHKFWDRLCFCRVHEHSGPNWHGGIYDFKTKKEYQPCPWCEGKMIVEDKAHGIRVLRLQYGRLACNPKTNESRYLLPDEPMPIGWRWF